MGQSLSDPVTRKESLLRRNSQLSVGVSSMQGWRSHMEDAHGLQLTLGGRKDTAYFGIFDGHGGEKVAQYAAKRLHEMIASDENFDSDLPAAARAGFLSLDSEIRDSVISSDDNSLVGSAAIVVLLRNSTVCCANAGDSRAVLSVGGVAVDISSDHKPSVAAELDRITDAGGWVAMNRVNGSLALSRAFGDFSFKRDDTRSPSRQVVCANPELTVAELTDDTEFILMACDGIWDVMTSQEAVNFVRTRLGQQMDPDVVCEELLTQCLAPENDRSGIGCDNMTAMVVGLLRGRGSRRMFESCAQPPAAASVYLPAHFAL